MAATTQTVLQARTRIDRSDLSGYGNGQKPDFVNMTKFCLALDVSPAWLMFGRGERRLSSLFPDPHDPARDLIANRVAETIHYGIDKAKDAGGKSTESNGRAKRNRDKRNPRDPESGSSKKR